MQKFQENAEYAIYINIVGQNYVIKDKMDAYPSFEN